MDKTLIINGKEYKSSSLSPLILQQLEIMDFSKIKLAELTHDLKFLEKAREGYLNDLLREHRLDDQTLEFGVD